MTTTQKTKSYFIGDLIDLVTDLGGTLKDSEKIWKEYINLLRNENVLDERFVLNEESPDVVKLGFQKAANFLEKKLVTTQTYLTITSFLSTARKQGIDAFEALTSAFNGKAEIVLG